MRIKLVTLFLLISLSFTSFSQNPCLEKVNFHFVILGSSTAAGAGASQSDSAWVNQFRAFLKTINSENEVTNLAVGGFNTYRIMPTGFEPPAGRPSSDPMRNITQAIALAPDAIIVNLPSNDVSSGYSVAEQLSNFDTIVHHAQIADIPIWICTTQPKNYGGNPIPIQKQIDVRDSILQKYAPRTLDFWSGLADTTHQLLDTYDSGDGTHLNDLGHSLLFSKVKTANMPLQLLETLAFPDYAPVAMFFSEELPCGEEEAELLIEVINFGKDENAPIELELELKAQDTGTSQFFLSTIDNPPGTCEVDTISMLIPTSERGSFELIASTSPDGNTINDVLVDIQFFPGIPFLEVFPDTGCVDESLVLSVLAHPEDSIRWFDQAMGANLLASGAMYATPPLMTSTSYYAEAFRGPFLIPDSLSAATTSSINWNGTMFDLVADTLLLIDSLAAAIHSLGAQTVEIYIRNGSHLGYETNPDSWTFYEAIDVFVTDSMGLDMLRLSPITIEKGDTVAFYLQLKNPNANLSYQWLNDPVTALDGRLRIIGGSGSNYSFGGSYYPRFWKGKVFYHYAENENGACSTGRLEVPAVVQDPKIDLGADTILHIDHDIWLSAGAGFEAYYWSDGSTDSTLYLAGKDLGTGIYTYSVTVTDAFGCEAVDEIIVVFAPLVEVSERILSALKVYPNPANEVLFIEMEVWQGEGFEIKMHNSIGQVVLGQDISEENALLNIEGLPSGIYSLHVQIDKKVDLVKKVVVE